MRMEERRRAEYAGKGNMEMHTVFFFGRMGLCRKPKQGAKSCVFSAAWTAERGEGTLFYTTRAGLPECR